MSNRTDSKPRRQGFVPLGDVVKAVLDRLQSELPQSEEARLKATMELFTKARTEKAAS